MFILNPSSWTEPVEKKSLYQGKIHWLNNTQFTSAFGLPSTCAKKNGRIQFLQVKKQFKGGFKVEVDVSVPFTTWLPDYLQI